MLTSGLFPSCFTTVNSAEMNITRVVFTDMLNRMSSKSQQECGGGPGCSNSCEGDWPLTQFLHLGPSAVPHVGCSVADLILLHPSWDPEAATLGGGPRAVAESQGGQWRLSWSSVSGWGLGRLQVLPGSSQQGTSMSFLGPILGGCFFWKGRGGNS